MIRDKDKKLLVGYILAGYKDCASFFDILEICENSPLDILEIGFPSENPCADGPVIVAAHKLVNKKEACSLSFWKKIRANAKKPIWLMAYKEDFITTGLYLDFAKANIADAFVIPNMSIQEHKELALELKDYQVEIIGFSNPDMDKDDMHEVFSSFTSVYEQLYVGQTGSHPDCEMYHPMLEYSLTFPSVSGFAGFGISTKENVIKMYRDGFQGTIIGTEIIRRLNTSNEALKDYLEELGRAKIEWKE